MINVPIKKYAAIEVYPELIEHFDKDGLLIIDDGFELHDGGLIYKDHVLHYHQFLRRGFTSNPNFDFISRFINSYRKTKRQNKHRIAIDPFRIMHRDHFESLMECDGWFGPNFDINKLDDINSVGLTVKKRNHPSFFDLTNKIDKTEFLWSYRDNVKTLQIEEISSIDQIIDGMHINRFIHTERHVIEKKFQHFDGAVKIYDKNYDARINSQMSNEKLCAHYIKLFRIDGDVNFEKWLDLISFFFKGNEMILEYFDPEKFERVFGERIRHYNSLRTQ